MSTTVQVPGGFEITSNSETAEEMVKALTPKKDEGKVPKVIVDKGKRIEPEPEKEPLSKAASELGKAGGKAAAEARKEKAEAKPAEKPDDKPAAKEPETPETKEAKPEEKAEPKPKAKDDDDPRLSSKARIAELARERAEERAARQAAEQELARLRAERQAPKEAPAAPEPGGRPKRETFATEDEYIEAVADWKAEQRIQQARREDATNRVREERSSKFRERIAKDPDFVSNVDPRLLEMVPAHMLEPGAPLGPENVIAEALVTSERAVELFHYLTDHPEEMVRLIRLPNGFEIGRAVGQLEDRLASKAAPKDAPEPEPEVASSAPPPMRPVAASSVTPEPDVTGDLDFDSFARRRGMKRS